MAQERIALHAEDEVRRPRDDASRDERTDDDIEPICERQDDERSGIRKNRERYPERRRKSEVLVCFDDPRGITTKLYCFCYILSNHQIVLPTDGSKLILETSSTRPLYRSLSNFIKRNRNRASERPLRPFRCNFGVEKNQARK